MRRSAGAPSRLSAGGSRSKGRIKIKIRRPKDETTVQGSNDDIRADQYWNNSYFKPEPTGTTVTNYDDTATTSQHLSKAFDRLDLCCDDPDAKHHEHSVPSPTSNADTSYQQSHQTNVFGINNWLDLISPGNKEYSTRNSLRSSQGNSDSDGKARSVCPDASTMTDYILEDDRLALMRKINVDHADYYVLFDSDNFVVEIDGFCYCALCAHRIKIKDGDHTIDRHIGNDQHVKRVLSLKTKILDQVPEKDSLHINALSRYLGDWYYRHVLTDQRDLQLRLVIVEEFRDVVRSLDSECDLRVFGSFMTQTCLKTSDLNLELLHPNSALFESDPRAKNSIHHKLVDPDADYGKQVNNHTLHYDLIGNAAETLFKIGNYFRCGNPQHSFQVISTIEDLNNKVPKLVLLHKGSNIKLTVNCYADHSYKISLLLTSYMDLDGRARTLASLVKYWAQICKISRPEHGTYSPDAYLIFVIFFLQRTDPPVLPCLHEISRNLKNDQTQETIQAKNLKEEEIQNASELIDESQDNFEDDAEEEDDRTCLEYDTASITDLQWESQNDKSVPYLFMEFMKFMHEQFNNISTVISIRTTKDVLVRNKPWNTQIKALENPIRPKINMSRTIGSHRAFFYIRDCFKYCYYYLTSIPLTVDMKHPRKPESDPRDYSKIYTHIDRFNFYFNMREESIKIHRQDYNPIDEMINQRLFARDVVVLNNLILWQSKNIDDLKQLPSLISNYYDTKYLLPIDCEDAVEFCWLCRQHGHFRDSCLRKTRVRKLHHESEKYNPDLDRVVNLDECFLKLYQQDLITPQISKEHMHIVSELTRIIHEGTGLDCKLELFGSAVNLLGSRDSDLDLCLTINGNLTGKGLDSVLILGEVHSVLEHFEDVKDIEPILSARVPILKFRYHDYEIDLSMYNQCAIHNSQLLRTYVLIDPRVAQLCYLVKRFAKSLGIADASRGSLSSYAWSLMVIHFLQKVKPPILPVLQERRNEKMRNEKDHTLKPIYGVNGWNVWFRTRIKSISMPPNYSSLTQLIKKFFLYYSTLAFDQYVITIRSSRKITKFQKNWTTGMIAIEDPFELTYNLSGRLDDSMALYIIDSFHKGYYFIHDMQVRCRRDRVICSLDEVARLFVRSSVMNYPPPYRGCRRCHRIGHKNRDCPELNQHQPDQRWFDPNRRQRRGRRI